jgi:hypothetical protein
MGVDPLRYASQLATVEEKKFKRLCLLKINLKG